MSSRGTILLTEDNEHFYHDCNDDTVILEFDGKNINIRCNDIDDLIVEIKPNNQLHKLFTLIQHNDIIRAEIEKHIPNIL